MSNNNRNNNSKNDGDDEDDINRSDNDDDDGNDDDDDNSNNNNNYFYEMIGAPILLYRNRETYTMLDESPTIWNYNKMGSNTSNYTNSQLKEKERRKKQNQYNNSNSMNNDINQERSDRTSIPVSSSSSSSSSPLPLSMKHHTLSNAAQLFVYDQMILYRIQSRWYYPMDYHLIRNTNQVSSSLPNKVRKLYAKYARQRQQQELELQQQQQQQQHLDAGTATGTQQEHLLQVQGNRHDDTLSDVVNDTLRIRGSQEKLEESIKINDNDNDQIHISRNSSTFNCSIVRQENDPNNNNLLTNNDSTTLAAAAAAAAAAPLVQVNNNDDDDDDIDDDNNNDREYTRVMEELQKVLHRHQEQRNTMNTTVDVDDDEDEGSTSSDDKDDDEDYDYDKDNDSNSNFVVNGGLSNDSSNGTTNTTRTNKTTFIENIGIRVEDLLPKTERTMAVKQMFRSNEYNSKQMFTLQMNARIRMLLEQKANNSEDKYEKRRLTYYINQIMQAYTQLDTNYIPGKDRVRYLYAYDRADGKPGICKRTYHKQRLGMLNQIIHYQTQFHDRERCNRSLPEYMAPFVSSTSCIRDTILYDFQDYHTLPMSAFPGVAQTVPAIPSNDVHRPTVFGNCLLSFPCQCRPCCNKYDNRNNNNNNNKDTRTESNRSNIPVPCILHPVGALQDRVRLSFVQLGGSISSTIGGHDLPRKDVPEEITIDARIRQIELCGKDPYVFIVRTDIHCTVCVITFICPRRPIQSLPPQQQGDRCDSDECWGSANIVRLHRIDHRCLIRSIPSYQPIDMSCHPKYSIGTNSTPCNVVVVFENVRHNGTLINTIHHYQITKETYTIQKFHIPNLQTISEITFSNYHPMILYCVARSYIRPALTSSYHGHVSKKPRLGHGLALYSIDLRQYYNENKLNCILATYQWSPNVEEYTSEGIHSISGIQMDWTTRHVNNDGGDDGYYCWISSISAGRTYMIDLRTPCQTIHTFSLPYLCTNQPGTQLPPFGLYGAGTLFSYPYQFDHRPNTNSQETSTSKIMLNVCKSPNTFGIHMYQPPSTRPHIYTQSIECIAGPNLVPDSGRTNKVSFTKSSILPLPDVSEKIFVCGLTSFVVPVPSICNGYFFTEDIGIHASKIKNALCVLSLTNKGDVYAQVLVQSTADRKYAVSFDNLPLGYSAISVPNPTNTVSRQWNVLSLNLSNEFPILGHTIRNISTDETVKAKEKSSVLDLTLFLERDEIAKHKRKLERKRLRRKRRLEGDTTYIAVSGDEYDGRDVSRVHVPLNNITRRTVVTNRDMNNKTNFDLLPDTPLTLPSYLLPRRDDENDTGHEGEHLDHFEHVDQTSAETYLHDDQDKLWRSDLTAELLESAWEEHM